MKTLLGHTTKPWWFQNGGAHLKIRMSATSVAAVCGLLSLGDGSFQGTQKPIWYVAQKWSDFEKTLQERSGGE